VPAPTCGQACSAVLTGPATGPGGQPGKQIADALLGAAWSLRPAIAHAGGHLLAPLLVDGQTGSGGQAMIAVLAVPCSIPPAIGHGSGRQSIATEFRPAADIAHGNGGQMTPVVPDAPLEPVSAPAP
jgi:hypothetical protein